MINEVEPIGIELNGTRVKITYQLRMTNNETGHVKTENYEVMGSFDRKHGKLSVPIRRIESVKRKMEATIKRNIETDALMAHPFLEESAGLLQEGLNG